MVHFDALERLVERHITSDCNCLSYYLVCAHFSKYSTKMYFDFAKHFHETCTTV